MSEWLKFENGNVRVHAESGRVEHWDSIVAGWRSGYGPYGAQTDDAPSARGTARSIKNRRRSELPSLTAPWPADKSLRGTGADWE